MKQKELNENLKSVIVQARAIDIPVPANISEEVIINPRPKKRFGCCRKQRDRFLIEVSEFILDCSDDKIIGVLAHEVLHTCAGCSNHGKIWKAYAAAMNRVYGYNIKRTSTFEEMGLINMEPGTDSSTSVSFCSSRSGQSKQADHPGGFDPLFPPIKYIIKCRKCGREYPRQRRSKAVKNAGRYRCACGGKLTVIDLTRKG